MTTDIKNPDKTVAALIHLSTFSQFFFPLGNFIFPLVLWTAKKNDPFVNEHGKQALNFQISIYLYAIALILLTVAGVLILGSSIGLEEPFYWDRSFRHIGTPSEAMPLILYAVFMGLLMLSLFVLNIYAVISATVKAGEGEYYKYPLTINFINSASSPEKNQS